mmetsp:Transcript_49414/g.163679  ORF Transcript_49414/g.163679 Transcript_49414/m.163679 type:complete len:220 (+) Transcript_49414:364-1023(+)
MLCDDHRRRHQPNRGDRRRDHRCGRGVRAERLQQSEQQQRDHVVQHGGGDDQLANRRVERVRGAEHVERDADGGGRKRAPRGEAGERVEPEHGAAKPGGDAHGQAGATQGDCDTARADGAHHWQVGVEARLEHQQQQSDFSVEHERFGERNNVEEWRPHHKAHGKLAHQRRHPHTRRRLAPYPHGNQEEERHDHVVKLDLKAVCMLKASVDVGCVCRGC